MTLVLNLVGDASSAARGSATREPTMTAASDRRRRRPPSDRSAAAGLARA